MRPNFMFRGGSDGAYFKPEDTVVRRMPFQPEPGGPPPATVPLAPTPTNPLQQLANQMATMTPEAIGPATKWSDRPPTQPGANQMAAMPFGPGMGARPQYAPMRRMRRLRG